MTRATRPLSYGVHPDLGQIYAVPEQLPNEDLLGFDRPLLLNDKQRDQHKGEEEHELKSMTRQE